MKRLLVVLILSSLFVSPVCADDNEMEIKPFFDFFRKLIEPKQAPKRKEVARKVIEEKPVEVIPPLQIQIMGISGDEGSRIAIITYKGSQILVEEGQEEKGEFKVIRIDEDKVTFLHIKAGKRQVVKL